MILAKVIHVADQPLEPFRKLWADDQTFNPTDRHRRLHPVGMLLVRRGPNRLFDLIPHLQPMQRPSADPRRTSPSPALLERRRERTLAALAAARAGSAGRAAAATGFAGLLTAAGTSIPRLARDFGLGRAALTDLVQGRMTVPMPKRLVRALAGALATTADVVAEAARLAAASPQMGRARAHGSPAAAPRSFVEIVRDDPSMTPERKAFWLAPDEA